MHSSLISLFFTVEASLAASSVEEFHHMQLLQTKVKHPKVAVDAQGVAHDETALFQVGLGKVHHVAKKARAHAVKAKFTDMLKKKIGASKAFQRFGHSKIERPERPDQVDDRYVIEQLCGDRAYVNGDVDFGDRKTTCDNIFYKEGGWIYNEVRENRGQLPDYRYHNFAACCKEKDDKEVNDRYVIEQLCGDRPYVNGDVDFGDRKTTCDNIFYNEGGWIYNEVRENRGQLPDYRYHNFAACCGGAETHDEGREACAKFYGDERVDQCMECAHPCAAEHECRSADECVKQEGFMMCHGECMGSPLGKEHGCESMQACTEFYPGKEGECMECGGRCHEQFPCDGRDSCMNNEGFMACHHDCMHDEHQGGDDEGEKACKEYYPNEFEECWHCGGKCHDEHPCESFEGCAADENFMNCHTDCMGNFAEQIAEDPEVQQGCKMMYGEDVDTSKCAGCGWECFQDVSDEGREDPSSLLQCMDKCVEMDNLVEKKCKEAYGEEVDMMQCLGCGIECQCGHEGVSCDECHAGCMGYGHEESEDEAQGHCKEFYGFEDHWDIERCVGCAGKCYEEQSEFAEGSIEWFTGFMRCQDHCLGGEENRAFSLCNKLGGEEPDYTYCFTCGYTCCESMDHCEGDGYECMESCYQTESSSSSSSWPFSSSNFSSSSSWPFSSSNFSSSSSWPFSSSNFSSSSFSNSSSWPDFSSSNFSSSSSWKEWRPSSSSSSSQTGGKAAKRPGLLFGRKLRQDVKDGTDLMQLKKNLKKSVKK